MPLNGARRKQVSIDENVLALPDAPSEAPHLLGSKCRACGAVFFPQQHTCQKCFSSALDKVKLSRRGRVYSCTVFRHHRRPPGYKGPLPYLFGQVELPEGAGVLTLFTDCSFDQPLKRGTEVELLVERFGEDEAGNDVMTFKFRPVQSK
ncbi:MAG: Zn-ribbon domain-containing OB-fold protein [Dehalococcoidia bacterium]|nr:Zn-ribbon domain-containing OB-fold protein [Dehalococcoidia bacterium]